MLLAFACLLAALAVRTEITDRFDNLLLDQALPYAAPPPSDKILIVEIDERSLAEIGSWPWKRSVHAQLINKLSDARPLAIGYDVLFTEPSEPAEDAQLGDAIASSGKVMLPFQYQIPGANGRDIDQFLPIEPLPTAAAGLGHVGLRFDTDGLVRRVELKGRSEAVPFQHLMEVTAGFVTAQKTATGSTATPSGPTLIPLLPRTSFRTLPAVSILNNEVSPDFIEGKIVLVGASAQGMADIFPVAAPAGSIMPGIEIQANLLNGLLANQFVKEAGKTTTLAASLVLLAILMAAFWTLKPRSGLILAACILVGTLALSALLAVFARYWIAPGPALLGILILYPLWGWRRLAALNDFVAQETSQLDAIGGPAVKGKTGTGLDVIARQAERLRSVIGELNGRQKFISGVIDAAPDAICVVGANDRILLVNQAAEALFGEPLAGKSLHEVMAFQGQFAPHENGEWTSKTGRTMLVTASDLSPSENGAGSGKIYSLSDITEIRDAERERKEMLEFLSHDMRSPQAAIMSLIDGSQSSSTGGADILPRIRTHAARTLGLTEDFVQLARLETVELRVDEYDLAELLREAVDANYEQARAKSIHTKIEVSGEFHYVSVDGSLIVRALSNLINNAIKYAPQGSTVTCKTWSEQSANGADARATCEIRDQGPGLPVQRLSDPFGRFGYRDETQAHGSGLGLAFVKQAVERNDGTIECLSSPAEGTQFVIRFPELASE